MPNSEFGWIYRPWPAAPWYVEAPNEKAPGFPGARADTGQGPAATV